MSDEDCVRELERIVRSLDFDLPSPFDLPGPNYNFGFDQTETPDGSRDSRLENSLVNLKREKRKTADPERTNLLRDYKLEDVIGRGGFSIVNRATRLKDGRTVAIKFLKDAAPDEKIKPTRHENLVKVHEVLKDNGNRAIVMDYVGGETLQNKLGKLNLSELFAYAMDIVAAEKELVRQGIFHCDLKPGNVIVCRESGRAKVTDYGLAAQKIERAQADQSLSLMSLEALGGTPGFTDRRVGLPKEHPDYEKPSEKTEVYSAAATIYAMMHGKAPFDPTDDPMSKDQKTLKGRTLKDLTEYTLDCLRKPSTRPSLSEMERTLTGLELRFIDYARPWRPWRPEENTFDLDEEELEFLRNCYLRHPDKFDASDMRNLKLFEDNPDRIEPLRGIIDKQYREFLQTGRIHNAIELEPYVSEAVKNARVDIIAEAADSARWLLFQKGTKKIVTPEVVKENKELKRIYLEELRGHFREGNYELVKEHEGYLEPEEYEKLKNPGLVKLIWGKAKGCISKESISRELYAIALSLGIAGALYGGYKLLTSFETRQYPKTSRQQIQDTVDSYFRQRAPSEKTEKLIDRIQEASVLFERLASEHTTDSIFLHEENGRPNKVPAPAVFYDADKREARVCLRIGCDIRYEKKLDGQGNTIGMYLTGPNDPRVCKANMREYIKQMYVDCDRKIPSLDELFYDIVEKELLPQIPVKIESEGTLQAAKQLFDIEHLDYLGIKIKDKGKIANVYHHRAPENKISVRSLKVEVSDAQEFFKFTLHTDGKQFFYLCNPYSDCKNGVQPSSIETAIRRTAKVCRPHVLPVPAHDLQLLRDIRAHNSTLSPGVKAVRNEDFFEWNIWKKRDGVEIRSEYFFGEANSRGPAFTFVYQENERGEEMLWCYPWDSSDDVAPKLRIDEKDRLEVFKEVFYRITRAEDGVKYRRR